MNKIERKKFLKVKKIGIERKKFLKVKKIGTIKEKLKKYLNPPTPKKTGWTRMIRINKG